jgi:hypothetical protein
MTPALRELGEEEQPHQAAWLERGALPSIGVAVAWLVCAGQKASLAEVLGHLQPEEG